ncbi:hypothetical protein [Streptomyces sp. KR80]|uniref:hypothetical protein n=1 Tax=Streptomyces sp. KR80 TaxID=3457426 RepID=UPI003FD37568
MTPSHPRRRRRLALATVVSATALAAVAAWFLGPSQVATGTTPSAGGTYTNSPSPAPSPAASALTSPSPTRTSARPSRTTTTTSSRRFRLLAPGAALPSGARCATAVRAVPIAENKADNATANRTAGKKVPGAKGLITRVNGNFTGTTGQILRWAACKWGINEDMVKAQVAVESWWRMNTKGDWGTDASRCPAGHKLGADGKPGTCPESYGLLQVRYPYNVTAFPGAGKSSAMNVDYGYAVWRECYEGRMTWLNTVERGSEYRAGDAWGCMGVWFSGRWHNAGADKYIARVKEYRAQRIWETPNFQQP